ncbi:MAG: hypothetical protein D6698_09005 [Gammaproteobacteria bacterium]|nr:MAG: hypothetical protein D6698_09005 [Gammaproteobacteria bacterium]
MRVYQYKSPLGLFLIKPQTSGRWGLWFKGELLGSYHSAMAAADDVYMQATGDYAWDTLKGVRIPMDISEWEVVER